MTPHDSDTVRRLPKHLGIAACALAVVAVAPLRLPLSGSWEAPPDQAAAVTGDDEQAVREVAQLYLDGLLLSDTAMLRRAFWTGAQFQGVPGRMLEVIPVERWIESRANKRLEPREDHVHRVLSVDVSGDAASAKVELVWPSTRFVDYLSLLRMDGEWRIVNKIWHQEPSARALSGLDTRPLPAGAASRYTGAYRTERSAFDVVAEGNELLLRIGEEEHRLFYQGDHTFAPAFDPETRLRFLLRDGMPREIEIRQGGNVSTARRAQ